MNYRWGTFAELSNAGSVRFTHSQTPLSVCVYVCVCVCLSVSVCGGGVTRETKVEVEILKVWMWSSQTEKKRLMFRHLGCRYELPVEQAAETLTMPVETVLALSDNMKPAWYGYPTSIFDSSSMTAQSSHTGSSHTPRRLSKINMHCLPSRQNNCRYETLYLTDCLAAALHHQILLCFQRHWRTKIDSYVSAAINRCSQPTNQPASLPASPPGNYSHLHSSFPSSIPLLDPYILKSGCGYWSVPVNTFSLVHFLLGRMSLLLY